MSKAQKLRIGSKHADNTERQCTTIVYLVDEQGNAAGRATLETKPGCGLHYRFENAMKLMIKEPKTFI